MLDRRAYLATLAAGSGALAGCAFGATAPRRGYDRLHRRVRLAGQDSVPDDVAVRIEADLLEPTVTGDHTARVQITTTNEGPPRSLSVGTGGCDLLNRRRGGSDDPPGLWLHSAAASADIDRDGNRWVAKRPRAYFAYGCLPHPYDSGESVTNEYALWHDSREPGYLTPGTYRWAEDVQLWDEGAALNDSPARTITWGFSLGIEAPE